MTTNGVVTRETFKVFELFGKRWKVSKLNALDGANIIRKFNANNGVNSQVFLSSLSNADYLETQEILLNCVQEVQVVSEAEVLVPVILPGGGVNKVISDNADLVYMLTVVSLTFNMSGFFEGNVLKEFQGLVKTFNA